MTEDVLGYIVGHWKSHFTGVSGHTIASEIEVSHEGILKTLDELAAEGKVILRPIRETPYRLGTDEKGDVQWREQEPVDTQIAFPTRDVLHQVFEAEGRDHGPFTNRLHLGDSQVKHYFFDAEVLEAYRRHPEQYDYEDDVMGGSVTARSDYYLALPEDEREDKVIPLLRYGKRRLRNGRIAIGVIVHDLHELPRKEQIRWAGHEVENPEFAERDEDFEKYERESFGAEFLEHDDPLKAIVALMARINERLGTMLFLRDQAHPQLRYPVTNSAPAYTDAHRELFKVVGTDALSKTELKRLLTERLGARPEDFINPGGQPKGSWVLFRTLLERGPHADFGPFQASWEARQESAHKILEAPYSAENFVARFRAECEGIVDALRHLDEWLAVRTHGQQSVG